MKKGEDNYKEVYQGADNNCLINNLIECSSYKIRICCVYNDIIGDYSQSKEVIIINSLILIESKRQKEFLENIFKWSGYKNLKLIYRGTKDGMSAENFHNKCDKKGPTIVLIKNEKGHIFGGYSSISWESEGGNISDSNAFIFTLTNIYNTQPTKFENIKDGKEVYHKKGNGPIFGRYGTDICTYSNFITNKSNSSFPNSFKDVIGKGKSIFSSNENSNEYFIKEMEVFSLE